MPSVQQHTPEQLNWLQMQNGQEQALANLYDQYVEILFHYGKKFTHQPEIIEDAIQDLMTELWFKRDKLSLPKSIQAYLFASFRQKILRHISRSKRISLVDQYGGLHILDQDNYVSQQEKIETNAFIQDKLMKAMKKLSPKEREAIHLRYTKNLKHEEISSIMDIKKQSLYNLLHTAVIKLSKALNDEKHSTIVYLLLSLALIFLTVAIAI